MRRITNLTVITCLALIILHGCGSDPLTLSNSTEKSGTVLLLKASAKQPALGNSIEIPVPGGDLSITSALLHSEEFEIEGSSDNKDAEGEFDEIEVKGPFIDINNGEAFIDSVTVFPGTFKKVELKFALNTSSPFDGKSIVMRDRLIMIFSILISNKFVR